MDPEEREILSPDDADPRAVALLTDPFFWDNADSDSPLGSDTGAETLALFRAFRVENPDASVLDLLTELLARWEVADTSWDAATEAEVAAAGADDEYSLLMRDDVILALAFAQLVDEGRIDAEIQRRAVIATVRQALPLLLITWGDRTLERAQRLDRMRQVLVQAAR